MTDEIDPEQVRAIVQREALNRAADTEHIMAAGAAQRGEQNWNEECNKVGEALGHRAQEFMGLIRHFEQPHQVIGHLANNESRLKELAKMSAGQMAAEVARIEAQMSPNGRASLGPQQAYKQESSRTGRVSDEDWSRSYGSNLSDNQWNREFDRRMAARAERKGRR